MSYNNRLSRFSGEKPPAECRQKLDEQMRQAPHDDDEHFNAWMALTAVCHSKLAISKHE